MEEDGPSSVSIVEAHSVLLVRSREKDESFMAIIGYCSQEMNCVRKFEEDALD